MSLNMVSNYRSSFITGSKGYLHFVLELHEKPKRLTLLKHNNGFCMVHSSHPQNAILLTFGTEVFISTTHVINYLSHKTTCSSSYGHIHSRCAVRSTSYYVENGQFPPKLYTHSASLTPFNYFLLW